VTASLDPARLLAQASELMGAFAALELAGRPGDELADVTLAVERLANQVHGARLRAIAAFDASGVWEHDGAASAASWLRGRVRSNAGTARGLVRDARAVRDALPGFASGLADGEVAADHVRVVAASIDRYPERRATLPEIEPALADAARAVDPATLRQLVDRWTTTVDPEHAWDVEQDRHATRALSLSRTLDGMVAVDGLLDAEGGAALTAALDALVGADRTTDVDRTPRQRRADALVELALRTLDTGDLPRRGGERPHLQVTIPMALVLDRQSHGAALDAAGGSATLTADAAFRFLCDGTLVPVLESTDGGVLDVGAPAARSLRRCGVPSSVGTAPASSPDARPRPACARSITS
jgi:hypothetical protein